MKGMNASTGRSIVDLDHLYQSVAKILTTPLASCVKRRTFGSEIPDLVDAPFNGATRTRLYAAVATAIMKWEPRIVLTRVQLNTDDTTDDDDGVQVIDLEGYTTESGDAVRTSVNLNQTSAA
ncbi:GPW/gp25 family protein [Paraburkholderia sp. SIMBA_027]|uniref:GPW/gp25 family protein n=1 Tax=Paraburkholderia sp. SIMBA_027 TaxID=3085770 RepID=UPI00397B8BB8